MIVLYPLLLLVALVFAACRLMTASTAARGWRWFAAWYVAGAVFTFSFITGLSIGLLVLPAAAVLLIWVAWFAPRPAEALGFVAGIGLILFLVAFQQRDYTPCPPDASPNCGGFDPAPGFLAGIFVTMLPLLSYVLLRKD
jgi:hypothetical protein